MKDVRKDVDEANEIAKFMNKDITFTHIYVSKFDDEALLGANAASTMGLSDLQTEV